MFFKKVQYVLIRWKQTLLFQKEGPGHKNNHTKTNPKFSSICPNPVTQLLELAPNVILWAPKGLGSPIPPTLLSKYTASFLAKTQENLPTKQRLQQQHLLSRVFSLPAQVLLVFVRIWVPRSASTLKHTDSAMWLMDLSWNNVSRRF